MALDLDDMNKKLDDALSKLTKEEIEMYFSDNTPKGWVSIEDDLPQCLAMDFITKGYSVCRVKDNNGNEFDSHVTDHNVWYYEAKDAGITHWWNE